MPTPADPKNYSVYSIQTVYSLYEDVDKEHRGGAPILHCKNVIKIPIAEPVAQQIGIDTYTVIPCIAYVFANGVRYPLKIFIETNEGVTVEPIRVQAPLVQYNEAFLLTLPRGTTGIKKAYIRMRIGNRIIQNDLVFDIMEAPYNYENYLLALNHAQFEDFVDYALQRINSAEVATSKLSTEVNNLKARVGTLENKVGG
jgi:hypothetical protein